MRSVITFSSFCIDPYGHYANVHLEGHYFLSEDSLDIALHFTANELGMIWERKETQGGRVGDL